MLIITDTCFWTHSIRLFNAKILDVRLLLLEFDLLTTNRVLEEIENYRLGHFVSIKRFEILPISDEAFNKYPELSEMDIQDGSLVIAYDQLQREDAFILTEIKLKLLLLNNWVLLIKLYIIAYF